MKNADVIPDIKKRSLFDIKQSISAAFDAFDE
jgi:hypothetical protein